MTWQQCGAKRYYYRNVWQDGRSVRIYVGTREVGELAATADQIRRVHREINARWWQQEQQRRAAAEALVVELCEQSDLLVRATLIAAGYHQHARGVWRRKRVKPSTD